jgi:hypothetical protein
VGRDRSNAAEFIRRRRRHGAIRAVSKGGTFDRDEEHLASLLERGAPALHRAIRSFGDVQPLFIGTLQHCYVVRTGRRKGQLRSVARSKALELAFEVTAALLEFAHELECLEKFVLEKWDLAFGVQVAKVSCDLPKIVECCMESVGLSLGQGVLCLRRRRWYASTAYRAPMAAVIPIGANFEMCADRSEK